MFLKVLRGYLNTAIIDSILIEKAGDKYHIIANTNDESFVVDMFDFLEDAENRLSSEYFWKCLEFIGEEICDY